MTGDDGYPTGWQSEDPGPYPAGMPIWRDSWGDLPQLVYYGNGTVNPGPLLPIRWIAQTTINYNAGVGPALEPIPLALLQTPSVLKTTIPAERPIERAQTYSEAKKMPFPNSLLPGGGFSGGRTGITPYYGGVVNSRVGDIIGATAGLCDRLPPGYKEACQAAAAVGKVLTGARVVTGGTELTQPVSCPAGYTWSATLGRCIALQNALPGGQPMTLTRNEPTTGGLGLTAVTPLQVGTITRNDGSTGPILRCPRRYVLGQDYLCYPKAMIPNQLRAHPRGTRPLLTGGEVKILRRAKSLEKKVTKLGHQFGKKVCHCSKPTRRKK